LFVFVVLLLCLAVVLMLLLGVVLVVLEVLVLVLALVLLLVLWCVLCVLPLDGSVVPCALLLACDSARVRGARDPTEHDGVVRVSTTPSGVLDAEVLDPTLVSVCDSPERGAAGVLGQFGQGRLVAFAFLLVVCVSDPLRGSVELRDEVLEADAEGGGDKDFALARYCVEADVCLLDAPDIEASEAVLLPVARSVALDLLGIV
jgi:hypothetical protein